MTQFGRQKEFQDALAVTDRVSERRCGFGFVAVADLSDVAVTFSLRTVM